MNYEKISITIDRIAPGVLVLFYWRNYFFLYCTNLILFIMQTYKAWRQGPLEIRNYGCNGFNVYFDGSEIDYFTYYGSDPEKIIKEYIKDFKFNNLF